MSRLCEVCKKNGSRSSMPSEARHLHELPPNTRFRFSGEQEEVHILEGLSLGRATIMDAKPRKARAVTSFVTSSGEHVSFKEGPASSRRPCTPFAMVVPLR